MEVQKLYGDQVRIVGVPSLADEADFAQFIDDTGVDVIEHIPDVNGVLWNRFGVSGHRTYVLVNDDGTSEKTGYGSLGSNVENLIAR